MIVLHVSVLTVLFILNEKIKLSKKSSKYGYLFIDNFGCAKKFLLDNVGEFDNDHFIPLCENLNIHICTTAAESPWSNRLIERYHAILGYTVTKTDLNIASSWAISAKNSLKNVYGFSSNQLVFSSNTNLPNNMNLDYQPMMEKHPVKLWQRI